MDSAHQKILLSNLGYFVKQVNSLQLLIYLPCLSDYSKDEIETAYNSKSKHYAAQILHSHLIKKPDGFHQLISALRHDDVGCTELADRLNPNHTVDYDKRETGRQDDRRQSQSRSDYVPHSSPPDAEGWHAGPPRAVDVQTRPANMNGRHFRSQYKCNLNTPWDKLPPGVKTILRKFDTREIDHLAELLGFDIGETSEITAQVPPGESLTLAFLERWIPMESNPVTLGVIMEIFHDLRMEYILRELERKTGVKFEGREERDVSPEVGTFSQGGAGLSDQERNKVVDGRTRNNPNINMPTEKISGTDKSVLDVARNRHIPIRQSPNEVCPGNTKIVQELRPTSSGQTNNDSEGFQIQAETNNLGRSVSNCCSNTENSTYDSMPNSSYMNDLDSGDDKRSVNHHSSNINNTGDEPGNAESPAGSVEKVAKWISKEDGITHNFKVEKTECSERLAEMNAVVDNSENLLHHSKHITGLRTCEWSKMDFDEEKILGTGQNISDIISQCDPPDSRESSISGISASSSLPVEGKRKKPTTKAIFNSIEHYVDHSLEDDKQAAPEETNYSKELNSIEKKAEKKLPGHDISFSSPGVEINNSFGVEINNSFEDPTGSFKFDWNLSRNEEAVSMNGETGTRDDKAEQPLLTNQLLDQQLDQSNLTLQHTGNEEMELTRRGPLSLDFPESASNQVHKFKEVCDTVGRNMSSERAVIGSTTACSEPVTFNTAVIESVSYNSTKGEIVTVNTESLQSSLTVEENEVSDVVIYRNNLSD
ncbi:uncharacterized protein LOC123547428 [Mercenaria mercenaria]|uniref:uncharacterized protein LOC123547428 n=1 Tax=Mercenaria mercenaria TaxID=6596 RepID=UPI00234F7A76|nr:uncharacterized protein LOC123547428 [Mercenaria mercenaria]